MMLSLRSFQQLVTALSVGYLETRVHGRKAEVLGNVHGVDDELPLLFMRNSKNADSAFRLLPSDHLEYQDMIDTLKLIT